MGEVGGTDYHYDGERKRPAYPFKCPACGANNIGRIEEGCPQCNAGKDGKIVGIPKVTRRARPAVTPRLAAAVRDNPSEQYSPSHPGVGPAFAPRTLPASRFAKIDWQGHEPDARYRPLLDAAITVLQHVRPTTQEEIDAMLELERAVQPFLSPVEHSAQYVRITGLPPETEGDDPEPPPLPPLAQDWDARTILTLAAALDHFAEQILVNLTSDDFLSADEAQQLANDLRATLPEDLDSVLPQISAQEPEGEAQP